MKKTDELEIILEKSMSMNFWSPNFIWQMHPSRNIPAIVANHTSALLNQNMIAEEVSQGYTKMENQVIWFLADLIGYDIHKSWWSIVSWGTVANHTAMLVARNLTLSNDWDWVAENWIHDSLIRFNELNGTDYKDVVLFVWEDNHYSIDKIASYVWIWSKKIQLIPYDENYKLNIDCLSNMVEQSEIEKKLILWVSVTAWTTEKWHVHDIEGILSITKWKWQNWRKIYTHVDAAHWWWFLVDDNIKNTLFKWIDNADSVTMDGHKMFFTNYSCWWIVFKDSKNLSCLKQSAKYILDENSKNENHWSITLEWSRWSSWVHQLWTSIKHLWKKWYKEIINKLLDNTKIFHELLENDENFEILSWKPDLNLVCFRFKPKWVDDEFKLNEINLRLKQDLIYDWEFYVWDTTIDDKKCFRSVIMNFETSEENLKWFISKIKELYSKF